MRLAICLLLLTAACTQRVRTPTYKSAVFTKETTGECVTDCKTIGMRLSAVVIIHNSAGCVCEPAEAKPAASRSGGAAAAGGAVLAAAEEEEQEEQRQRTRRQEEDRERRRREQPYQPPPSPPPVQHH